MSNDFLAAVIIESPNAESLARFYRETVGLALEESDDKGQAVRHFECELGDVHFAIYPEERGARAGSSRIKLAFAVDTLDEALRGCAARGIKPVQEPVERGFGRLFMIHDPDGNRVYLTELSQKRVEAMQARPAIERSIRHAPKYKAQA